MLEIESEGPNIFLDALNAVRGHEATAATLFQVGPRPEEALRTARLLKEEGTLIPRLIKRSAAGESIGLLQPEALPHDAEARRIHRLWARRLLERGLSSPDDRFDRIQAVLRLHAPTVAGRLDGDLDFRRRFLDEIAPLAESVLLKESDDDLEWGTRAGAPVIWGYLQEHGAQGRDWFERYGRVAVDILMASEYRDVRAKVAEALKFGDEKTIEALLNTDLRNRDPFINLLKRDLPPGTLAVALADLQADPQNAAVLLSGYGRLTDAALIKELGPPPSGAITWLPGYSLYELADKLKDGRSVGASDVAFAALDAGEVFVIAKGAKVALKTAVRSMVKDGLERKGATTLVKTAEKATERQLLPWMLKEARAATRAAMKETTERATRAMTVDATEAVHLAFKGSGVGRETFKNLTALEARVFMRKDRRVFVELGSALAKDHVLGRYLRATAVNGGVIEGFRTATATVTATESGRKAARVTAAQMDAWKKHVGAWWLAHANRSLDRLVPPVAAAP